MDFSNKRVFSFIPTVHAVTMRVVEVRAYSAKGSRAGGRWSPSLVFCYLIITGTNNHIQNTGKVNK